jgi:hypothetical protein
MQVSECQWTNNSTPVRFHLFARPLLPPTTAVTSCGFPCDWGGMSSMRGFKLGKGEDKVMADARPSRVAGNYLAHWQDITSASCARRATV